MSSAWDAWVMFELSIVLTKVSKYEKEVMPSGKKSEAYKMGYFELNLANLDGFRRKNGGTGGPG